MLSVWGYLWYLYMPLFNLLTVLSFSLINNVDVLLQAELPDVKPGVGFIKSEAGMEGETSIQSMPVLAPDGDRTK